MTRRARFTAIFASLALTALALVGCSSKPQPFAIVLGSENQILEPIVRDFCVAHNFDCSFRYLGSLDMAFGLKPDADLQADAVWPAASIWVDVYDTAKRVKSLKSIIQSPVILGVRLSKAKELGWVGTKVTKAEILSAVEAGKLKFLMTSATQSNSGAAAYLSMLASALGKTDIVEAADLDKPEVIDKVRRLLAGVERSSGSSGWLADLYLSGEDRGKTYDAMWNYETIIKETNDSLKAKSHEPLYAVYPEDGVTMADSPIGFIDRGRGKDVEAFFEALQAHLLSGPIQAKMAQTGRRIELGRADPLPADPVTNLDPSRKLNILPSPDPATTVKALNLYQEALRKPSLTALCLDLSGSMGDNGGEQALLKAMTFLLTPQSTREVLVQWTPSDQIIVLPFDSGIRWSATITGRDEEQQQLLQRVLTLHAGGGTDFYTCAARAIDLMRPFAAKGTYLPAIVIMTDGQSQGVMETFEAPWRKDGTRIPIFGVTFGSDADKSQLERLAKLTGGRVFDGTKSLTDAFRSVRGYN